MPYFDSIFVTTDFSPCARYAVDYAAAFAKRLGAPIHLGHVVDTAYLTYAALYGQSVVIDPDVESVEQAAREFIEKERARLEERGLTVEAHLSRGNPLTELVKHIEASGAGLVVTGTHGHSGFDKFLFGSTCEKLVRKSPVPVLAVKQSDPDAVFDAESFALDQLLVTTDLSDLSKTALEGAAELCRRVDAELTLLHVVDSRYESFAYMAAVDQPVHQELHAHAERLLDEWKDSLGISRANAIVQDGVPHQRIDDYVRGHNIDLTVMATHGHGGMVHALVGSTTERVVKSGRCPVLSIRPVS